MKSKAVALLLADLGVTKSHSRPYVSDDNPVLGSPVQDAEVPEVDLPFVVPLLDNDGAVISGTADGEEEYDNPER